jgi:hypothetical protein
MRASSVSTWAVALLLAGSAGADPAPGRVWEVNGVRLEPAQVERLADDIAHQTVLAVARLDGLELHDGQERALEAVYRDVALEVYDQAVGVVNREDLPDDAKEAQVKELVLNGQRRSTAYVKKILDPGQYAVYGAWEDRQVEAFRRRGLWSSSSRGRRPSR